MICAETWSLIIVSSTVSINNTQYAVIGGLDVDSTRKSHNLKLEHYSASFRLSSFQLFYNGADYLFACFTSSIIFILYLTPRIVDNFLIAQKIIVCWLDNHFTMLLKSWKRQKKWNIGKTIEKLYYQHKNELIIGTCRCW